MDRGVKTTTNGRELLMACAATGTGLDITRFAVGSGRVPEGVDLADVHALYEYVADGAIGQRTHENDRLYLTVQYANKMNPALPSFTIAEFMVYARHPETGEETDLLYGTLGSYLQPVPAYRDTMPVSAVSFPLVIVLSDEIEVAVSAPAGLVTHDELEEAVKRHSANAVISQTPPESGPALWFCSNRAWRPDRIATAELGDPADADRADVVSEVNNVVYPVLNATVTEEGGSIVATIEQS